MKYPKASLSNPPPRHRFVGDGRDQEEEVCQECGYHSLQWWHQGVTFTTATEIVTDKARSL